MSALHVALAGLQLIVLAVTLRVVVVLRRIVRNLKRSTGTLDHTQPAARRKFTGGRW